MPGTKPLDGVCPTSDTEGGNGYPVRPDRVTLGDKPYNPRPGTGNNMLYNFNLVPRMDDPKFCGHRPDFPRGGCEQYLPCASRWDPVYTYGARPAVRVWGPGFNGDDVVRGSREAYQWEVPCPNDNRRCYTNYYSVRMVIGRDGSPGGRYEMCVAPSEQTIRTDRGACRFFDLRTQ